MEKTIVVSYKTVESVEIQIPLVYEASIADSVRTMYCKVNLLLGAVPAWLRPLRFVVRALYNGTYYQPLLNETSGVHTLNAALFMEAAQTQILKAEDQIPVKKTRT